MKRGGFDGTGALPHALASSQIRGLRIFSYDEYSNGSQLPGASAIIVVRIERQSLIKYFIQVWCLTFNKQNVALKGFR
ncbi:hypothetical protein BH11VER1_BH11VER1_15220 [soil metagenome]